MRLSYYEKLQRNLLALLQRAANGEQIPEQQIACAREALAVVRSIEIKLATKRAALRRKAKLKAAAKVAVESEADARLRLECEQWQNEQREAEDAKRRANDVESFKIMAQRKLEKEQAEAERAAEVKPALGYTPYKSPSEAERLGHY